MTIREEQKAVADIINADRAIAQGGGKALIEDSLTLSSDLFAQIHTLKGVAIVVVSPQLERSGKMAKGAIPCTTRLEAKCMEMPALRHMRGRGALTALDIAILVAKLIDGAKYNFSSIRTVVDADKGVLTAKATFNTWVVL